jgi:VanZ family protein
MFIIKKFIPAILFTVVLTVLLCLPGSAFTTVNAKYEWLTKIYIDKWVHVFLFFVAAFLWMRPVVKLNLPFKSLTVKIVAVILVLVILYGLLMELIQLWFVPNRSFEWLDILADAFGAFIGYVFAKRLIKKQPQTAPNMDGLLAQMQGMLGKDVDLEQLQKQAMEMMQKMKK